MSRKDISPPETVETVAEGRDRERLRDMLLEGRASPLAVTADANYFDRLRSRVRDTAPR